MTAHEKAVEAAEDAGYLVWRQAVEAQKFGVLARKEAARAAITAYLNAMKEAGWVMVPKKATDEMQRAGIGTIAEACRDGDVPVSWQVWDDMVDAAMLAAQEG